MFPAIWHFSLFEYLNCNLFGNIVPFFVDSLVAFSAFSFSTIPVWAGAFYTALFSYTAIAGLLLDHKFNLV